MKHPRTIILSSHLLNELENILDEVLLIDEGQKRLHLSMDELREYAVGLQGERDYIENFTAGKEILYQKDMGRDNIYKIDRNDFSSEDLQKARLDGISVSQIPPDKICIYLTAREGEEIDDVLDRA